MSLPWSATEAAAGTLRLAFASRNRSHIDQHFGAAEGFVLYTLDAERARLAGVLAFPPENMDGNENKLAERIAALAGADAVYCLAAGNSAIRQLLAMGIQPMRVDEPKQIDEVLHALRNAIRHGGLSWVDRCLRRGDSERFERMLEEGWQD